jgi:hypothetical protein
MIKQNNKQSINQSNKETNKQRNKQTNKQTNTSSFRRWRVFLRKHDSKQATKTGKHCTPDVSV